MYNSIYVCNIFTFLIIWINSISISQSWCFIEHKRPCSKNERNKIIIIDNGNNNKYKDNNNNDDYDNQYYCHNNNDSSNPSDIMTWPVTIMEIMCNSNSHNDNSKNNQGRSKNDTVVTFETLKLSSYLFNIIQLYKKTVFFNI